MKNTLKKILSSVLLSIMLIVAPVAVIVSSGCKSTPQQIAYKSLRSVQQASVAALNIYGAAYKRGEIDETTRAKVLALYTKYQVAFSTAVTVAQFNYDAPSTPELTAAAMELINLVNTLRK